VSLDSVGSRFCDVCPLNDYAWPRLDGYEKSWCEATNESAYERWKRVSGKESALVMIRACESTMQDLGVEYVEFDSEGRSHDRT